MWIFICLKSFTEKTILYWIVLASSFSITDKKCEGLFWNLNSTPLNHKTVFMPLPYYLDYCRFVSFKSGYPPTLYFLFKIILAILDFLIFHIILWSCEFCKEAIWDFDRDCINCVGHFREYCHLNYIAFQSMNTKYLSICLGLI